MDGKNVDTVLMELGVRFHRLIYEHLQQYSYSCMGGMLAICDVAEYRKCAKDFKVSYVYVGDVQPCFGVRYYFSPAVFIRSPHKNTPFLFEHQHFTY